MNLTGVARNSSIPLYVVLIGPGGDQPKKGENWMENKKKVDLDFATVPLMVMLATILLLSAPALAAEGGGSHYGPGFYGDFGVAVAPDPGFYLKNDFYYYTADASRERVFQYGEIRVDLEVEVAMYMLTGLAVLDAEILGGRYAFAAFLPVVYSKFETDVLIGPLTASLENDRTAIGDPGIVPVSIFWNFGNFHINAYETVTVPVGAYDVNRDVNAGLNYWSFETSLAATWLHPERGHEVSVVLGYIYNTENEDTDYQTGQEFHVEYMLNQFFSETFALGIHGSYYKQVTGDSGQGAILGDFKGEAASIGPALMWATDIKGTGLVINAKWLHEFHAEHRLEGDHLFINFTFVF
jgi:hypothetical protein